MSVASAVRILLGVLVVITLGLFLFVVVLRLVMERRDKRSARLYEETEPRLLEALREPGMEKAEALAEGYRGPPRVLAGLLFDYARNVLGEGRDKLIAIFVHALSRRFLADAVSPRDYRRLRAARLSGLFSTRGDREIIQYLLQDEPAVRLSAANALASVATEEAVSLIFQAFENEDAANVHPYESILFRLGFLAEPGIRQALRMPMPTEKIVVLIEVAGAIPLRTMGSVLAAFMGHPNMEVRLRVARALGRLLDPDTLPALLRLAEDGAWQVQDQAVKSLGRLGIGSREALDAVERALYSRNWYVRFDARGALLNLGEAGIRRLEKVSRQAVDRYAAEMAAMGLLDAAAPGGGRS